MYQTDWNIQELNKETTLIHTIWYQTEPQAFRKLEELKVNIKVSNTLIRQILQHFENVFRVPLTEGIRTSFRILLWDTRSFLDSETNVVNTFPTLKPAYGDDRQPLSDRTEEHIAAYATTHLKMIFEQQQGKDERQDSAVGLQGGEEVATG